MGKRRNLCMLNVPHMITNRSLIHLERELYWNPYNNVKSTGSTSEWPDLFISNNDRPFLDINVPI